MAVNEAVERASRDGILTCASLMVGAPAAADAVARARRLPRLRVGLHLVLVNGTPVLQPSEVPALVDAAGRFDENLFRAGLRFAFHKAARRQLATEIRAQFAAFAATGLALDHVNAHRHIHLHPAVARLMIAIGRDFGLRAVRVPREPIRLPGGAGGGIVAGLHAPWAALLARRVRRAGLKANDHLLGLARSGRMTEAQVMRCLVALPPGVSELYSHPAATRPPVLVGAMPLYRQTEELAALISPAVRRRVTEAGIPLIAYGDLGGD